MDRIDIPRETLKQAVAHATEKAGLTGDAARKLRDFALYAKTVGSNFHVGCPMARTALYVCGEGYVGVSDDEGDRWVNAYDMFLIEALPFADSDAFTRDTEARVIG